MTFQQSIPLITPTTGLLQIGSAPSGVYLDNAEVIVLAADLRKLLETDPSASQKDAVWWFVKLLESVKQS